MLATVLRANSRLEAAMCDDPEEQTIELTIEALTGTIYDLCVSPFETILGIKMRIQQFEGIPVYQQQLVYGGVELLDEFCLEEYAIPSGAQLKLLIAMKGGPIHAHRVRLEDPTLLEIAELLDAEGTDHKYTVMLVRDGEPVDMADFVQMYNEDSCESVSCSPVQVSESHQKIGVAANKATQTEHALTKDKMKEVMAKLKKLRSFRKYQPSVGARQSTTQLQRKGTSKVLILDAPASTRLLQSSVGPSSLHTSEATTTRVPAQYTSEATTTRVPTQYASEATTTRVPTQYASEATTTRVPTQYTSEATTTRVPTQYASEATTTRVPTQYTSEATTTRVPAQRKLVFSSSEKCWHKQQKRHPLLKRAHSPEGETPIPHVLGRHHHPKTRDSVSASVPSHLPHPPHHSLEWRKAAKRPRTNSFVNKNSEVLKMRDAAEELADQVSQLVLDPRDRTVETRVQTKCSLPKIPSSHTHRPSILTYNTGKSRTTSSTEPLPPIVTTSRTALPTAMTHKRRNRCLECGKKMGLATTYSCRCGGLFCAIHRYAETHSCTFDYKAEGRQMIARNNPVVTAPKLPKI